MSKARPRPIRRKKVTIGFIDAANRAAHIDMLTHQIYWFQAISDDQYVFRCLVRNLVWQRRKLAGAVIAR